PASPSPCCFLSRSLAYPHLPSFPTRRSSDLFCDLKLSIQRAPLARHVRRLYADLERRGIEFRPHVWLSEEWFSPDGVPGIAMPLDRKSTRLNSSHGSISYAVFCLKKKKQ